MRVAGLRLQESQQRAAPRGQKRDVVSRAGAGESGVTANGSGLFGG